MVSRAHAARLEPWVSAGVFPNDDGVGIVGRGAGRAGPDGHLVHAGDGFLAAFDGPARAILCARSIAEAMGELGLEVRSGLHTGECEVVGEKLGGIAVHIGARVAGSAQAGEVLVSSTVKDLVAGS